MEKIGVGKQQTETTTYLFLRWGNKKRLRCVRVRDFDDTTNPSFAVSDRRRINSHFVAFKSDNDNREPSIPPPPSARLTRNSEAATSLSNRKSSSERGKSVCDKNGNRQQSMAEEANEAEEIKSLNNCFFKHQLPITVPFIVC